MSGVKEPRQHLSPARIRRDRLIRDRRVAREVQRGHIGRLDAQSSRSGASAANSRVSLSSQLALPISRGFSATRVPPVAFAGSGAESGAYERSR